MTPAHLPHGAFPALPAGPSDALAVDRPGAADPTVFVPAEDPPGLAARITPAALLGALRRCWGVAVPVGLVLGVAAAAGAWVLRPDKYTSAALIWVQPATRILADQNRQPEAGSGHSMRTQLAVLRSPPVLKAALKDEKVKQSPLLLRQNSPEAWLEKELRAEQVDGTELIRLSLTVRGDGSDLAPILKAVVASYLEKVKSREEAAQNSLLNEIERAHTEKEEAVRKLRDSIYTMSRDLKGGDPQVLVLKQTALVTQHSALLRELAGIDSRRRELEVRLEKFKRQLAPPAGGAAPPAPDAGVIDALVERELEADPRTRALLADEARLKLDVDALAARSVDPANPVVAKARDRLEVATKLLQAARADKRGVVVARQASAARAAAAAAAAETQADLDLLDRQRGPLKAEAEELNAKIERYGLNSVDLEAKRVQVERSEAIVKALWDQKERLGIELKGGNRQRVTEYAAAEPATVANPLGRAQEAAGAGLVGLLLGLFAVSFREARRGRIHHAADVARGLRLPVVGALPAAPAASLAEALRLAGPAAGRYARGLAESADALRTRLLRGRADGGCPVLMVASPGAGEGKTTLAAQLAASLARAGYATLLVDGDLRRPSLHGLFGVDPAPGLCDLLAGEYGADAVVRSTPVDGLHLLPAGLLTPRASAGLAQAVVPALFDGLRARYDFVVLDSSPLLLVSDAFLLGRCADGVLLSVRPGVSQAADVYAGYRQVVDHRLPFTGVVVNGVPGAARYAAAYESHELSAGPAAGDLVPVDAPAAGAP